MVKYGIMLPGGDLARVHTSSSSDGYCCGTHSFRLTDDSSDPEWLVDDPKKVADTLFGDVRSYNSNWDHPCWGRLKQHQMRPCKVERTVTEAPEIKPPVNIEHTVDCRDIPYKVAGRYAGRDFDPGRRYVFVLAMVDPEEVRPHIGGTICFHDLFNKRQLEAVVPTPDEFVPECEKYFGNYARRGAGDKHCLLICSVDQK